MPLKNISNFIFFLLRTHFWQASFDMSIFEVLKCYKFALHNSTKAASYFPLNMEAEEELCPGTYKPNAKGL